jgi:hypothetical protein
MLPGGDIAKGFVCHLRWPELRVCGGRFRITPLWSLASKFLSFEFCGADHPVNRYAYALSSRPKVVHARRLVWREVSKNVARRHTSYECFARPAFVE